MEQTADVEAWDAQVALDVMQFVITVKMEALEPPEYPVFQEIMVTTVYQGKMVIRDQKENRDYLEQRVQLANEVRQVHQVQAVEMDVMEKVDQLVLEVTLVLMVHQVRMVRMAMMVNPVQWVTQEDMVYQEVKEQEVAQVMMEMMVQKDPLDTMDVKVIVVHQDLKVQRDHSVQMESEVQLVQQVKLVKEDHQVKKVKHPQSIDEKLKFWLPELFGIFISTIVDIL